MTPAILQTARDIEVVEAGGALVLTGRDYADAGDGFHPLTMFAAPRPWVLDDQSGASHPFVAIRSHGRNTAVAYKYDPMPSEVRDFEMIVAAVNAFDPAEPENAIARAHAQSLAA